MLTSPREFIRDRVAPMEEDDRSSPGTFCVNHHDEPAPQTRAHSSVFHSCEDAARSPACQRMTDIGRVRTSKRQRTNPSPIKQSDARNNNEEKVDIQDHQEDKTETLSLERELPEDPPKRWVIGPLFQSFKSKMASFTDIVMSPVRSFKSNYCPPPSSPSGHHKQLSGSNLEQSATVKEEQMDMGSDHNDEVFSEIQAKNTPQKKQRVVQRLVFDSDSGDVNHSEANVNISPKRSKLQSDMSSSSGVSSQLALTDGAGTVHSDGPSLEVPCPDISYCSHSLTTDADGRGPGHREDATLGMSTRASPGKGAANSLEYGSEGFSLVEAAMFSNGVRFRKTVDNVAKPLESRCNEKGGSAETSASCDSSEREKMGQECRSQTGRKRDVRCRAPAALGIVNDTSDISSSFDVTKGATVNSDLRSDITDGSDGGDSALMETFSPASVRPHATVTDGASGKSFPSRKTRRRKNEGAVQGAERRRGGLAALAEGRGAEAVVSAGPLVLPAGPSGPEKSGDAVSDLERTEPVCGSNIRQAKHKLETSDAPVEPAAKRVSVCSKRAGAGAVKRTAAVFGEQRVSMSLTLQVGPAVQGRGDLIPPSALGGSLPHWQPESLLKSCRMAGRRGKGSAGMDRSWDASSTHEFFKDRPSVPECARGFGMSDGVSDEVDGQFSQSDVSKRVEETVEREVRRRGAQEQRVEQGTSVAPLSGSGTSRLLRSLSCPDIPSLQDGDHAPLALSHDKLPPSPHKRSSPAPRHAPAHCPYKRARRHTVCTVEIEREIAPLCLRKEVHPMGWASGSCRLYPCSSPSVLASCFLSSSLAFLSSKSSRGRSAPCGPGVGDDDDGSGSGLAPSPPRAFVTSPTPSPLSARTACRPSSPEWVSVSSPCRVLEPGTVEVDHAGAQHGREVADRSAFAPELLPRAVSEEKDSSHLEIKFQSDGKKVQGSKVSSIRIRKTLPKPQHHLTPMGLPKTVRIKKKVFSVEEIYTNKNFSQPPEGRLETIFEVPLSRRDGSQSLIGQKRVKRFVEFPELGVARKPRKPLIGAAGVGGAQRIKAVGNSGTGRTRRGVWASRDEGALKLESLLCSKLNELDSWMALEQMAY